MTERIELGKIYKYIRLDGRIEYAIPTRYDVMTFADTPFNMILFDDINNGEVKYADISTFKYLYTLVE